MVALPEPSVGRFEAMACPCEVLLDTDDPAQIKPLVAIAEAEARRIEAKYSRYLSDNIVHRINHSQGQPVTLDEETSQLIDFADTGYQLSDGLFDITTGVLRQAWRFNQKSEFPSKEIVQLALQNVGWKKVRWNKPHLTLAPGMEIDLGGIAKEYAVDRALGLIRQKTPMAVLVNFGGDIAACGPRQNGEPWRIGIENVDPTASIPRLIQMSQGGLATSGDSKRFILFQGKRYSHILNPSTGYPMENAPRSVTVAADTCTQAGFLSTLGMLKGPSAEQFLEEAGVRYWMYR